MALELVCGADFCCKRRCKTSPVVLEGFWGQGWPKIGRKHEKSEFRIANEPLGRRPAGWPPCGPTTPARVPGALRSGLGLGPSGMAPRALGRVRFLGWGLRGRTLRGSLILFKGRKSVILVVWAAPGAPGTLPQGGGLRPSAFARVAGPPGAAQTPQNDRSPILKPFLQFHCHPKCSHGELRGGSCFGARFGDQRPDVRRYLAL